MPTIATVFTTIKGSSSFRIEKEPNDVINDLESFLSTGSPVVLKGTDFEKKGKNHAAKPGTQIVVPMKDVVTLTLTKVD